MNIMFVYLIEGVTHGKSICKEPRQKFGIFQRNFSEKVLAANLTEAIAMLEKKELLSGFWEDYGTSHSNDVMVANPERIVIASATLITNVTLMYSEDSGKRGKI